MPNSYEGHLSGSGLRIGLVVGRFNSFISERLVEGALDALLRHGVRDEDIHVARVPGAFEIPLTASKMVETNRFDAVICLGAVIRGSTPHFDYVCAEVSKGVAAVAIGDEMGLEPAMPGGEQQSVDGDGSTGIVRCDRRVALQDALDRGLIEGAGFVVRVVVREV